ncbi:MAG: hypothetical protein ACLFP2_02825 [Candidatus Woesearchaeota archaeon]
MKELLFIPFIGVFVLGVGVQLESIAEESSDKAIRYAGQMSDAMDCAMLGRHISDCSPELTDTSFSPEIEKTQRVLENISRQGNQSINTSDGVISYQAYS